MSVSSIPACVKAVLWSYDADQLDILRDKNLVIKQVLDYGTFQAVQWMKSTYSEDEISAVIRMVPRSAWGKKSLALWSLLYHTTPSRDTRLA